MAWSVLRFLCRLPFAVTVTLVSPFVFVGVVGMSRSWDEAWGAMGNMLSFWWTGEDQG